MHDYVEQIDEFMEKAEDLTSPHSIPLIEEAIRLADAHQDTILGFATRCDFITATVRCGEPRKALVAFTWMLGQCDLNPEWESEAADELLSCYMLIAQNIPHFPEISKSQIDEIFTDMRRRTRVHSNSVIYVEMVQLVGAVMMGDPKQVQNLLQRWIDHWPDALGACQICFTDCHAFSLNFLGEYEKSLSVLIPMLETSPVCDCTVPMQIYSHALHPLMRLGHWKKAARYHQKSYKQVFNCLDSLNCVAFHIEYLAVIGDLKKAISIFEKQFPLCYRNHQYWYNYLYYLAVRLLMVRMQAKGREKVRLRMPEEFPLHTDSGEYQVNELADWFYSEAELLAKRFDARNGNSYHRNRLADNETLLETLQPPK